MDDATAVMAWMMEWSARGFRGDKSRSFENSTLVALGCVDKISGYEGPRMGSQYFLLSSPLLRKSEKKRLVKSLFGTIDTLEM